MNRVVIDIDNPRKGRYTLAQIEMVKRIKDFDSFKTFMKEERHLKNSWSEEKEKAFNERIDDLMEKNPEFKEKYTAYCKEREQKRKQAQRAFPLGDEEKARKWVIKRQAEEKLRANSQKTPIRRGKAIEI